MLLTLLLAFIASFFMAWTIGAGSSGSTPFAPAVGANAISIMRAGFIVGILGFVGAVMQGASVSEAVGRELVLGVTISPIAASTALVVAAGLVAIGVFTGYPIATAFTVTGAVIGAGVAIGGDPAWVKYYQIGLLWLLTPVCGGGLAFLVGRVLRSPRVPPSRSIPVLGVVVGVVIVNMEFVFLGTPSDPASLARTSARVLPGPDLIGFALVFGSVAVGSWVVVRQQVRTDESAAMRRFLLILGGLVAFSAGGSQVGLAIGPLLPLLDPYSVPLLFVLAGGGFGLLAGSWMGAPRMIKAVSMDYSMLGPRRSIAALIPSFIIAQIAIFYGIPVSFNEIIVSAVLGGGYAAGGGGVSRQKMGRTALAWIGALVLAFAAVYGIISTGFVLGLMG